MFGSPEEIFCFVVQFENKNYSVHLWLTITYIHHASTTLDKSYENMSGVICVFYMILYGITVQLKGRERETPLIFWTLIGQLAGTRNLCS